VSLAADLSDDELVARMVRRGLSAELARCLLLDRDEPETMALIEEHLR
jgi:hypothetical protein